MFAQCFVSADSSGVRGATYPGKAARLVTNPNLVARATRCTFPVGPFGIESTMITSRGTLNSAMNRDFSSPAVAAKGSRVIHDVDGQSYRNPNRAWLAMTRWQRIAGNR